MMESRLRKREEKEIVGYEESTGGEATVSPLDERSPQDQWAGDLSDTAGREGSRERSRVTMRERDEEKSEWCTQQMADRQASSLCSQSGNR
jgi:hypothetical protein